MSHHPRRFNISALSAAVLAVTGTSAYAQDVAESEQAGIEEVEVVGFRRAIEKSIEDKKFATNIKDTINAEDIGKNTDQNIAEALSRVTGVSLVNSADGEGTSITVRGATGNQTNISLNGQQLTSTDFSQTVDLSSFSSDILSKLEVVKTPSADHDEGSLGGSVNLVTVKPLDQKEDVRSLTLQGRYNEFSENTDYKIQGSITETFFDDTLGVALTIYDETNSIRRDQYRVENFDASPEIDRASDHNGELIHDIRAIRHTATLYELFQNTSDRQGGSFAIQFAPTDSTEMSLDVTYSTQEQKNVGDGIRTRATGNENFIQGIRSNGFDTRTGPDTFTDPQEDWYTVDTRTNTLTKYLNRYGAGDLSRSDGGVTNDSLAISFDLKHDFSDSFRMSANIGMSNSKQESLPNAYTNMQNFQQVSATLLQRAGADVTPVGYDCSSGRCELAVGSDISDLGDNITAYTDDAGSFVAGWEDNTGITSGFNPRDTKTFHLGFISETDRNIEDNLVNAQIDFDYDIDMLGLTTLEWGAKVSQREKNVDDQVYRFSSTADSLVIEDPITGGTVVVQTGTLNNIRADLIAGDGLDYDNFMSTLGYGPDQATSGWTPIDVKAAKDLIFSAGDISRDVDPTNTRDTTLDTQAVYVKANFEALDGRLTGDVGVRFVKTEVETQGYAGANFWAFDDNLFREFDLVKLRELRDTSLPACSEAVPTGDELQGYEKRFNRVDGLGYVTPTADPSTWTRGTVDQGPCHEPFYAEWIAAIESGASTEGLTAPNWQNMWRHADVSTNRVWGWDGDVVWDGESAATGDTNGYSFASTQNRSLLSFATENDHSYTNVLPSLNVNYSVTDDVIARFAVSKTMARPEIDELRSGFTVNENGYWGNGVNAIGSKARVFNTKLEPLESTNLDLSFEWYFKDSSYVSLALFRKDMKNFTDNATSLAYIQDLRPLHEASDAFSSDDLTLDASGDLSGCMPLRATADFGWQAGDALTISDDLSELCSLYSVTKVINGKNAEIQGAELGYSQVYDFLPGILGGLGMTANYTYQDSSYDPDVSPFDPEQTLPAYPVENTPEHTYNTTLFWERNGHQLRLSYRASTDSLVGRDPYTNQKGRTWNQGSLWNEGRGNLDFSASYQLSDAATLTFQAINLTDEKFRQYFTSRDLQVQRVAADNDVGYEFVAYNEGNPLDGGVTKDRTYLEYKIGTTYRMGLRVKF